MASGRGGEGAGSGIGHAEEVERPGRVLKAPAVRVGAPFAVGLALFFAALLVLILGARENERVALSQEPLHFDYGRAFETTRALAVGFPDRSPGTEAHRAAAAWIKGRFRSLGYEPKVQPFTMTIAGRLFDDLENIYAVSEGSVRPKEVLVIAGHYDVPEVAVQGAMDDASGVAVVLDLARVFKNEPHRKTIVFLVTDSEEYGALWGAKHFAERHPRRDQFAAVISIDHINIDRIEGIAVVAGGTKRGYAPVWLRDLAVRAVRKEQLRSRSPAGVVEYIDRAVPVAPADHGAFLRAGIPALNLYAFPSSLEKQVALHHTEDDIIDYIEPESFGPYGRTAERMLRSLDAAEELPKEAGRDLALGLGRSFRGGFLRLAQAGIYLPFLFALAAAWVRVWRSRDARFLRAAGAEDARVRSLLLGGIAGIGLLRVLPEIGVLAKYELYPATQKEPYLYNPEWIAIGLVLGTVVFVAAVSRRILIRGRTEEGIDDPDAARLVRLSYLAVAVLVALALNPFSATALLLLPAYGWFFLRPRTTGRGSAANLLLWSTGLVVLVAGMWVYGQIYYIGVVWWYMFLGAAYGLFSALTAIIAWVVVALALRNLDCLRPRATR